MSFTVYALHSSFEAVVAAPLVLTAKDRGWALAGADPDLSKCEFAPTPMVWNASYWETFEPRWENGSLWAWRSGASGNATYVTPILRDDGATRTRPLEEAVVVLYLFAVVLGWHALLAAWSRLGYIGSFEWLAEEPGFSVRAGAGFLSLITFLTPSYPP